MNQRIFSRMLHLEGLITHRRCSGCLGSRRIMKSQTRGQEFFRPQMNIMFERREGYGTLGNRRAEANEVEVEEDEGKGRKRFTVDGMLVTRQNARWMTKKKKKEKIVKVIEYKDIRDATYDGIARVFPQIEEFDRDDVKKAMADAAVYGFSPTKVAKIISRYPEFMDSYHILLPKSARAWRALGFSEADRVAMFHRHPPLMDLDSVTVGKGYTFLLLTFSKKEVIQLLKNCPEVIVHDEKLLQQKIDLLWKKYSHSTMSIAKCDALLSNEHRIEFRHELLVRAGLFKAMPFHKFLKFQADCDRMRAEKPRDKYLPPTLIVCTSDDKFLNACTQNNLSFSELSVFEAYFLKEKRDAEVEDWIDQEDSVSLYQEDEPQPTEDDYEESNNETYLPSYDNQPWRYAFKGANSVSMFNRVDNIDFYF